MGLYQTLRPAFFALGPERAHALASGALRLASATPASHLIRALYSPRHSRPVQLFGLTFPNPIGLAAGYDKDATVWRGMSQLGFGHVEVGTVTPQPQPGNPHPRLFRLPQQGALINRMGFPSRGAQFVLGQLGTDRPGNMVLGVNLGKNRETPLEQAGQDYCQLVDSFAAVADYLAINVSSPNTIGLRRLQARDALEQLLKQIHQRRREQETQLNRRLPILVKLAPDLDQRELEDALAAIEQTDMDGIIATNTTICREGINNNPLAEESGGLSGAPLLAKSTAMVGQISQLTKGRIPIVGVGGIQHADHVRAKLDAGASLVQIYTGLIYQGPSLVSQIMRSLYSTPPEA